MIAKHAPGLGDPWALTPAQWDMVLMRICEDLKREHGDVGAEQNRFVREAQWQKKYLARQ